jgi:hypothetical protein
MNELGETVDDLISREISKNWLSVVDTRHVYMIDEWFIAKEVWLKSDDGLTYLAKLLSLGYTLQTDFTNLKPKIPALTLILMFGAKCSCDSLLPYVHIRNDEYHKASDALITLLCTVTDNRLNLILVSPALKDIVNEASIVVNQKAIFIPPLTLKCMKGIIYRRTVPVLKRALELMGEFSDADMISLAKCCETPHKLSTILRKVPRLMRRCIEEFSEFYDMIRCILDTCENETGLVSHAFVCAMRGGYLETLEMLCVYYIHTIYAPPKRRHVQFSKEACLTYFDPLTPQPTRALLEMILDKYVFAAAAIGHGIYPSPRDAISAHSYNVSKEVLHIISLSMEQYSGKDAEHDIARLIDDFIDGEDFSTLTDNESIFTLPVLYALWELNKEGVQHLFQKNVIIMPLEFLKFMRSEISLKKNKDLGTI